MKTKNPLAVSGLFLLIAFMAFSNFLSSPGAEDIRNVQIVKLIATGMLIGISIAMLSIHFRNKQ